MKREFLKYKLAFLKLYSDNQDGKSNLSNGQILEKVQGQFLYVPKGNLEVIQADIQEMINKGLNPKSSFSYMRDKFSSQLTNIFSGVAPVKPDHLAS
mgnify:CR=1 FL=1